MKDKSWKLTYDLITNECVENIEVQFIITFIVALLMIFVTLLFL